MRLSRGVRARSPACGWAEHSIAARGPMSHAMSAPSHPRPTTLLGVMAARGTRAKIFTYPKFRRPNLNLGLLSPKNFGFVSKRMIRRGFQMSVNLAVTINKLTGARCERSLIRKISGFCRKIGSSTDFFRLGPRRNHGCTVLISMFHAA